MKVGDTIEMNFHGFGMVSQEDQEIHKITKEYVQIDAEDEEYMYKFNRKTGKCLNDNKYMGCYRTISPKNLI